MRRFWTFLAALTVATFACTATAQAAAPRPVTTCIASLASWKGDYILTADQARESCDKVITTKAQAKQVRAWQRKAANRATLQVWNWTGDGHKISAKQAVKAALCITVLKDALAHDVTKAAAKARCDALIAKPDASRVTYRFEKKHQKAFKIWRFNPKH